MKITASILFAVAVLAFFLWEGGQSTLPAVDGGQSTAVSTSDPDQSGLSAQLPGDLHPNKQSTRTAVNLTPIPDPKTFDEFVTELTRLGAAVWTKVEAGDEEAARPIDAEARNLLDVMNNTVLVPDEKALDRLTQTSMTDESMETKVRTSVLLRILSDGLKERWNRYLFTGSRKAADHLTAAILGCLVLSEPLAMRLGHGLLVDEPYLGSPHEAAVLQLVDQSAEITYLQSVSSRLLLTLWRNLAEQGERSSGKLASLALLFKDDGNPSRRLAAFAHLLTADEGRYRDLVLQHIRRTKDTDLAVEVAHTAAAELAPKEAIDVLTALHSVAGERMMGAFMLLGSRSTEEIRNAYEVRLADNRDPKLRAELIYGAGFEHGPAEIDLARLAFDHDPSVEVRQRAMFVLSSCGDGALAEKILMAAIDDPVVDADPLRIAAVVMAVGNLALDGNQNRLARVGERLLSHPRLRQQDRRELVEILRQHLPAGRR